MRLTNTRSAYTTGRNIACRILLSLLLALPFTAAPNFCAGAEELAADRVLDPDRLIEIAIELPAKDWEELCLQTRDIRRAFTGQAENPFTNFKGSITIDGVKIESVGIRKKGFIGSLDDQFPSLKIKFDEYTDQAPVKGIDVLTLNNNKQDAALVSQFLTYRLFNAAGVQAPRSNFARVTVNGEYLGIYSNVESIGKPFLKRRFGNNSGNLYEGTLADFYPKAIDRLEAKTNEKDHDRSKVKRLAELLADKNQLDLDEIGRLVDLNNFIKFWAVESLIGFWDGYSNNQNNYWAYENRDNGKFYFMPWGADGAFMSMRAIRRFRSPRPCVRLCARHACESLIPRQIHRRALSPDDARATQGRLERGRADPIDRSCRSPGGETLARSAIRRS